MSGQARGRAIEGAKAALIVDAMRRSVAERGIAASTFDRVAGEAGVSRGLVHYYFGTKERLLAEVVRRECDLRMSAIDERVAGARNADDVIDGVVSSLEPLVRDDRAVTTLVVELFTLAQRNAEVAAELAELQRRMRDHLADVLAAGEAAGILALRAGAGAVADVLLSMADGVAMRMLTEPARDFSDALDACTVALRALVD